MGKVITISSLSGLKGALGCGCGQKTALHGTKKKPAKKERMCRVRFKYAGKVRVKIVPCSTLKKKRRIKRK